MTTMAALIPALDLDRIGRADRTESPSISDDGYLHAHERVRPHEVTSTRFPAWLVTNACNISRQ